MQTDEQLLRYIQTRLEVLVDDLIGSYPLIDDSVNQPRISMSLRLILNNRIYLNVESVRELTQEQRDRLPVVANDIRCEIADEASYRPRARG